MQSRQNTTGESYLRGHFRAVGYYVPRRRVRAGINRVDPRNTALRWGALVSRRVYSVPWPNSLWHLDGHHSLIRWGLVIHGCIDGYSRRIIYLVCSSNNLAEIVLHLFETAIERDDGLWPSRIRVDYGVEKTAVCDAMVAVRGEGRGSFIAIESKGYGEMFLDVSVIFIAIHSTPLNNPVNYRCIKPDSPVLPTLCFFSNV